MDNFRKWSEEEKSAALTELLNRAKVYSWNHRAENLADVSTPVAIEVMCELTATQAASPLEAHDEKKEK